MHAEFGRSDFGRADFGRDVFGRADFGRTYLAALSSYSLGILLLLTTKMYGLTGCSKLVLIQSSLVLKKKNKVMMRNTITLNVSLS